MATIKRFEDLECWKEARKLVNTVIVWKQLNRFVSYINRCNQQSP